MSLSRSMRNRHRNWDYKAWRVSTVDSPLDSAPNVRGQLRPVEEVREHIRVCADRTGVQKGTRPAMKSEAVLSLQSSAAGDCVRLPTWAWLSAVHGCRDARAHEKSLPATQAPPCCRRTSLPPGLRPVKSRPGRAR